MLLDGVVKSRESPSSADFLSKIDKICKITFIFFLFYFKKETEKDSFSIKQFARPD